MKRKTAKPPPDDQDFRPDGWKRFEEAVDVALNTRPAHKPVKLKVRKRQSSMKKKES